jgi:hypothetical protein
MPDDSEPPVREFADRGVLWLLESTQNLHDAVRLLSVDIADRLDFTRAERQNRSFVPEDLHKQEADLLYKIPFLDGQRHVWVYMLLEHQSRPVRTMGFRILSYMVQIWQLQVRTWQDAKTPVSKWNLHPILPVVFYTGKRKWKTPISLAAMMEMPSLTEAFTPKWETLFLNLREVPTSVLVEAGSPVTHAFRALQAIDKSVSDFAGTIRNVTTALDALPQSEASAWARVMLYVYLLVRHTRPAEEQATLLDEMDRAVTQHRQGLEETKMTGAQVLINQGRKEGREEGREEMLLELLRAKFGQISAETETRIRSLTAARSMKIARDLLNANTLADLGL